MKFRMKNSQLSVKSQFMESKCEEIGNSLNRDFTVFIPQIIRLLKNRFRNFCIQRVSIRSRGVGKRPDVLPH